MMNMKEFVENTKRLNPGYFEKMCNERLHCGDENYYNGINSAELLEKMIMEADWEPINYIGIPSDYKAYVTTNIQGGTAGTAKLKSLPDDAFLKVTYLYEFDTFAMTFEKQEKASIEKTYIIIGKDNTVVTFHPGKPSFSTKINSSELVAGEIISKKTAESLGIEVVKLK